MVDKLFALVDCNNFYVSCERVFQPALQNRPVVVLSNNDGCIVARSNEAKALGIKMASPYHLNKAVIQKNNVAVLSSNYALYGDMSQRVMDSLRLFVPMLEVYSIDEAFLRLDDFPHQEITKMASMIRAKIWQWTGIPISIGIAPTKTLAKIANHIAKKTSPMGVFDMRAPALQTRIMQNLPVTDIWGVSRGWGKRLQGLGINTANELRAADPNFIRTHLSVIGARLVHELRGESCLDLEEMAPKKNIMSSKSFGTCMTAYIPIKQALAHYTARACGKLRQQGSKAQAVHVFLKTNRFRSNTLQYHNGATIGFGHATSDTAVVIASANLLLKRLFRKGYQYHKCGVVLLDLVSEAKQPLDLFGRNDSKKSQNLMQALDHINQSMGDNTVFYLAQGTMRDWMMRSAYRTPCYTTKWTDLACVI